VDVRRQTQRGLHLLLELQVTLYVGKVAEAMKLYQGIGFPYISGSSMMTPTGVRIGQGCP
jgi:hypothetical protein